MDKLCPQCGFRFKGRAKRVYCSRKCSAAAQAILFKGANSSVFKGGPPSFACIICGDKFERRLSKNSKKPLYCSHRCMAVDYRDRLSGQGNPAWRGGGWPYKGRGWKRMSESIVKNNCCAYCGSTTKLVAHHLIPHRFWLVLEEANIKENLVACCHGCHVRRPEHYWIELPDDLFNPKLHSKIPMPRTTVRLQPKPLCVLCNKPVKWARNKCCSVSCASIIKWREGKYKQLVGPRPTTIVKNSKTCAYCTKTFVRKHGIFCSRKCFLESPPGTPGKSRRARA